MGIGSLLVGLGKIEQISDDAPAAPRFILNDTQVLQGATRKSFFLNQILRKSENDLQRIVELMGERRGNLPTEINRSLAIR